jgi:hypothetical protein
LLIGPINPGRQIFWKTTTGSRVGLRRVRPELLGFPGSSQPDGYSQACYATSDNHERAVLRELLGELDLEGALIQADALHTQKPFFDSSRSRGPTSS